MHKILTEVYNATIKIYLMRILINFISYLYTFEINFYCVCFIACIVTEQQKAVEEAKSKEKEILKHFRKTVRKFICSYDAFNF